MGLRGLLWSVFSVMIYFHLFCLLTPFLLRPAYWFLQHWSSPRQHKHHEMPQHNHNQSCIPGIYNGNISKVIYPTDSQVQDQPLSNLNQSTQLMYFLFQFQRTKLKRLFAGKRLRQIDFLGSPKVADVWHDSMPQPGGLGGGLSHAKGTKTDVII